MAGKRWQVTGRDDERKEIYVAKAHGAKPPYFVSGHGEIAPEIRRKMQDILFDKEVPVYLNPKAKEMLPQARTTALSLNLNNRRIIEMGKDSVLFTWTGTRINRTLLLIGLAAGKAVTYIGIGLVFNNTMADEIREIFHDVAARKLDGRTLVAIAPSKEIEKYDAFLPEALLDHAYIANHLDIKGAIMWLSEFVGS